MSFHSVTKSVNRRRVVERIPYTAPGVDSLVAQVSALLKIEKSTERLILDVTKDYILLEKYVKGSPDEDDNQERLDTALRAKPMIEFDEPCKTSAEQVLEMFRLITDEGLEVTHLVVGSLASLDKWIRISRRNPRLFGITVTTHKLLPPEGIIVCGSEWRDAEYEDIRMSVKGVMS